MIDNISISITGRYVSRLNAKYNSDYCINRIYLKDGTNLPVDVQNRSKKGKGWEVTVTGYNLPTSKAKYYGEWTETKYGKQFKVSTYEFVTPDTRRGLISFLASKQFKGIGKKIAERIVDEFGMQSLETIKNEPERLLIVRGMTLAKINLIAQKLRSTEYYNQLAIFLSTYGSVESNKIMKIANEFGKDALERVKSNPYCMTELEGIGFTTADAVAKAMAQKAPIEESKKLLGCYQRVSSAIIYLLKENSMRTGGTYTEFNDIFNMVYNLLNNGFDSEIVSSEEIKLAFQKMAKENKIAVFNIDGKTCVLDAESNDDEKEISSVVRSMLSTKVPEEKKAYISAFQEVEKKAVFPFSEDQREAIMNILSSNIAILNGGPGTGKSTCMKSIIDCYKAVNRGKEVTLVAPTGKAARIMTENTGIPATTIHRACGIYGSGNQVNHEIEPFEGLVICDESSMVDSHVMRCFLDQIVWRKSKLILVGDLDQLPSVGAGAVLKDLIESQVPAYRLTVNHRQATGAGIIVENAKKIKEGETNLEYNKERFELVPVDSEINALNQILQIYEEECKVWGIENVAILCPRRQNTNNKYLVCVDEINTRIQNIVNPKVTGDTSVMIGHNEYRVRDRIIQMKNTEFASNGDIGVIRSIVFEKSEESDGEMIITIAFEGGNVCHYTVDDMNNVELAYAMTIHKSQGSEYKSVIMPFLSDQKCPLFQRNLIYTGVTRAKEKVILVGDQDAINSCISTGLSSRNTLLKQRILARRK